MSFPSQIHTIQNMFKETIKNDLIKIRMTLPSLKSISQCPEGQKKPRGQIPELDA